MQNSMLITKELFSKFQEHIDQEQETREVIKVICKEIDNSAKAAATTLQIIHFDIKEIPNACIQVRSLFDECKQNYLKLAQTIPTGKYYKYCDHWHYLTQRVVCLIALTVYLESGMLVTREEVADILGLKSSQHDGFHLDIEDYLMGLLNSASELSRFATNAVTQGDYNRPLNISKFVADLNAGFRLLNLKNDGLRKRFDALKYDVKKIEEVVYDISIRGLRPVPAIVNDEVVHKISD